MSDIGWAGLGLSGLLVWVAVALSLWRQLGLEASIVWAATRALAQLLLIGVVLDHGTSLLSESAPSTRTWDDASSRDAAAGL